MRSKVLDRILFFILGVIIYFSISYMWDKDDFHSFNQIINYNLDNIKPDENYAVINLLKDKRFVVVDYKDLGNTARVSYQNGRKTPSFSYGDISPLSVKSSMDIDRKKFTLSIELDKHIQYNLNHEI